MRLIFMGTPAIARPCLEAVVKAGHEVLAVVTQPDRKVGRGRKVVRTPVAALADELGLAVLQPEKIKDAADEITGLKADAACVLAFGQMLPPALLDAFPQGAINLHTSLLPKLRGAAPINWAIINGEAQTGVSTMYMDCGMDTGDIILQESTPIGEQETAGELAERLSQTGADIMVRTLGQAAQGNPPRTPQDPEQATKAPLMKKSDGLVDWTRPARELDWQVRGMDPWPSAHTLCQGKPMKLYAPTLVSATPAGAEPGTLIAPPQDGKGLMWVAAGDGALGLGQVQAAGKKRMAAGDYLRGARLGPGFRLGQ